ncbi:6668_t:CDS:2 [Dentiscutata heterogama]|uniref:6668_t:CDS:1 n=1 Tax=Dentiscutata heterogama TaxID=1316150 RepID=A0ACA9K5Q9_9GLOM|nr:6668_t:CDS:2 [Dentiscutata heterogama]
MTLGYFCSTFFTYEDGYNRIINELASINDLNLDSADEQIKFQEELIESLEVQEGEENEENIEFDGVPCIDGATENSFTLYAHILSFSGDLLALAKVMHITGHNSYKACCFCSIQGIYCQGNRHIYFPLKPPTGMSGYRYNPKSLPLRTHEDYIPNSEDRVFATDNAQKKLYSPSRKYHMNKSELKCLKAYYITALGIRANQLLFVTSSIKKYGKFQMNNGLMINSKLSNRKGDLARTNYCITAKLIVDRNAPVILEEKEFFGEVRYFFSHQYGDHWSMLAYVQWVRNPQPSEHGLLKFRAFEVINISAICRNVGFFRLPNNESYIIDQENRIRFR